jgi:hypothetical protein
MRDAAALLEVEPVTGLELDSPGVQITDVEALAECPHLASLTRLKLRGTTVGDEGTGALARSPYLARLTALDLAANCIWADGAAALARSPHLANLARLDLSSNAIEARGARALASGRYTQPCPGWAATDRAVAGLPAAFGGMEHSSIRVAGKGGVVPGRQTASRGSSRSSSGRRSR